MQRTVFLGSMETNTGSTQWAVRVGEETWTEANRKEGEERRRTVLNGGVAGGWWGWGARALGPLHKGMTACSGAAIPPGADMLGHTARSDAELEQFNAKYVKDNPVHRADRCEDYSYHVLGWLVGQGNLLGNMLASTNRIGESDQEFEIHENDYMEGDESDEDNSDEQAKYQVEKQIDDDDATLDSFIEDDSDDSEDDDPTYIPQKIVQEDDRSNADEESENETESSKRKYSNDQLGDKDNVNKKRKPSVDCQESEEEYEWGQEENQEVECKEGELEGIYRESTREDNEEEVYGDEEEEEEEADGEEEEDYAEEEGGNDDDDEEEQEISSSSSMKSTSLHDKAITTQTEEESSSSEDEEDEIDTVESEHDIIKQKLVDDDESGYSTHEQSMEIVNTPAA